MTTLEKIESALRRNGWHVDDASSQYASKDTKGLPTYTESWFHDRVWAGQIEVTSSYDYDENNEVIRDGRFVLIEALPLNLRGVNLESYILPVSVPGVMRAAHAMVEFYSAFPEQV